MGKFGTLVRIRVNYGFRSKWIFFVLRVVNLLFEHIIFIELYQFRTFVEPCDPSRKILPFLPVLLEQNLLFLFSFFLFFLLFCHSTFMFSWLQMFLPFMHPIYLHLTLFASIFLPLFYWLMPHIPKFFNIFFSDKPIFFNELNRLYCLVLDLLFEPFFEITLPT